MGCAVTEVQDPIATFKEEVGRIQTETAGYVGYQARFLVSCKTSFNISSFLFDIFNESQ